MKSSRAFTVIELIFVIVVLSILASVALPKFSGVREQADIAKGKADVATIRAAIVNERQSRIIKGDSAWITAAALDTGGLFGGVLTTALKNSNTSGSWYNANLGDGSYTFKVSSTDTQFDYNATTGSFRCTADTGKCNELVD